MTTESTKPQRIVAEGEPMPDLLEQLDELLLKTRRELTPLNEFYEELHVIECEVFRRLGEPSPARPRVVLNPPDPLAREVSTRLKRTPPRSSMPCAGRPRIHQDRRAT